MRVGCEEFFEESLVTHQRDTSVYKIKIEFIGWSFHIEYITNPVTSVKKDVEQENKATLMSKMKSLSLVRIEGFDQWLPISQ
jgi:BMFP domain-containing protein YqiC